MAVDKINTSTALLQMETASNGSITGTASSTGTAVTGSGTSFESELEPGDVIVNSDGDKRIVTVITSDTALAIDKAFPTDLSGATITSVTFSTVVQASEGSTSESASTQDVSDWGSQGFADQRAGLRQAGASDYTVWYRPKNSVHQALRASFDDATLLAYRLWMPDSVAGTAPPDISNTREVFLGTIVGFGKEIPTDGYLQLSVSIQVSGKPSTIIGDDS